MIQNILRQLGGIEQYGTISLCLFSFIFACVFLWAFLQRKSHLERMSRVPLENEESNNQEPTHE
jgi:cytochrome c oxidase cbb3-type subunit 4